MPKSHADKVRREFAKAQKYVADGKPYTSAVFLREEIGKVRVGKFMGFAAVRIDEKEFKKIEYQGAVNAANFYFSQAEKAETEGDKLKLSIYLLHAISFAEAVGREATDITPERWIQVVGESYESFLIRECGDSRMKKLTL